MNTLEPIPALEEIAHFVMTTEGWGTAGQPTGAQLRSVRDAGFEKVINLAWPSSPSALPDEDLLVEELGLEYLPIPVRWEQPTRANLQQFFRALDTAGSHRLFIHCIANKRVSAFLYLYRVVRKGMPEPEAHVQMLALWTPNEVWQPFLDTILSDSTGL